MYNLQVTTKANSVHDLAEEIGKKLAAAEQMGAEGQVALKVLNIHDPLCLRKTQY